MEAANVHSFYLCASGIEEETADKSPFAIKMIESILTKLPCFQNTEAALEFLMGKIGRAHV